MFFKHLAGYPKFKSKKKRCQHLAFRFYRKNDSSIRVKGKYLELKKGLRIKLAEPLRFNGEIKTLTIKFENGIWYASFTIELPDIIKENNNEFVGIDYGEDNFLTLSTGKKYKGYDKFKELDKTKRLRAKQLSHKVYGSNNYFKARTKLRRANQKLNNFKNDYLHKLSSALARRFSNIAIETLSMKEQTTNDEVRKRQRCRRNKKALLPFYKFSEMLQYKAVNLVKIDKWEATSQICSECGQLHPEMKDLNRRYITCDCGNVMDRDINAAINIKTAAFGQIKR